MQAAADPSNSNAAAEAVAVVLLLPELVGGTVEAAQLRRTLGESPGPARALLCLTEAAHLGLAAAAAEAGVDAQILLGPGLPAPTTGALVVHALPGTLLKDQIKDQIEFALNLSDFVLVAPGGEQSAWRDLAAALGKPLIAPGAPLPPLPAVANVTRGLDPDAPAWHGHGRRLVGRLEQALLESLAFNWRGRKDQGIAKSWSKLRECFGCKWRPRAYFADKWQASAPDRAALDPGFKLAASFDALDRSAVCGAYIHRDLIWIENFGAAFAVFFAVTGQVTHGHGGAGWGVAELVTLLWVAMLVLVARRAHLQDRWTACRLGAEQLRIARMTLPLLVLPQALATSDKPPAEDERSSQEAKFGNEALAYVKRVVRDQGLPRFDPSFAPSQAIAWVRLIVRDQITYHNTNHRKLECAESRLRHVTQLIFVAAVLAVVAHFCWHDDRLLLLTAAAPAFAAAAHATLTRLGIVHRAALSIDTERELKEIDEALDRVRPDSMNIEAWTEVRRLAFKAGDAMGRENTTWHGLVRRYRDEV